MSEHIIYENKNEDKENYSNESLQKEDQRILEFLQINTQEEFDVDSRVLPLRSSRKINILDDIAQMQKLIFQTVSQNSQQAINSQISVSSEELSQNKKEKKSFFRSLMALKNKQNQEQQKASKQPTSLLLNQISNVQKKKNPNLITDYFKGKKKRVNQLLTINELSNFYDENSICTNDLILNSNSSNEEQQKSLSISNNMIFDSSNLLSIDASESTFDGFNVQSNQQFINSMNGSHQLQNNCSNSSQLKQINLKNKKNEKKNIKKREEKKERKLQKIDMTNFKLFNCSQDESHNSFNSDFDSRDSSQFNKYQDRNKKIELEWQNENSNHQDSIQIRIDHDQ